MLRLITFLEEAAGVELVLPVTPSSYQWAHEAAIETVTVDQLGDLNFFGGKRMGSTTLHDCLLPAQAYPFLSPGAGTNPWLYLEQLERWVDRGTVVRWLVSGTPVNAAVLLEGVTYREQDGTNDLYLTIVMRQWKKPEVPVLSVSGGSAQTARDSQTGAASAKTYKVQAGDCLWSIAERYYGSGSQYKRLAAANPAIKNPNLIYPGQVLTIPAADDLPTAGPDSASVALADATASVWDPVAQSWTLK